MADNKDLIMFPSSGMSHEDAGDALNQKPMLEMGMQRDNKPDGDLPSIPDVKGFGEGPDVIQSRKSSDSNPCPDKPGAEY